MADVEAIVNFTRARETSMNWYSDCRRYFIAETDQGGKAFFDAWRIGPPQAIPLPGTPFKSLLEAQNACSVDSEAQP